MEQLLVLRMHLMNFVLELIFDMRLNANGHFKIAIVCKDSWLTVVFHGFAAIYPLSTHHRIGLEAMQI